MSEYEVGTPSWFDLLTFEERLGHVQVWAKYADKAEGDTAEGTLFHLRWLVAQLPNLRAKVLAEAADSLKARANPETERGAGVRWAADWVRSMADTRGPNLADDILDARPPEAAS